MVTRLVAGTFSPSVLLDVARRTGRLSDAGLEVTEVPVASSPGQFRSLVDGEIDVAFTSPDNVLAYRFSPTNPLGGLLDVGIVSGIDRGLGLALYGRPGSPDPSSCAAPTSPSTCRSRASRWRCTRSPRPSASPAASTTW